MKEHSDALKVAGSPILGKFFINTTVYDDKIIEHACMQYINKKPNIYVGVIKNSKFDLLFESSIRAIKDNYYKEGISTLASCLERFQEYVLEIIIKEKYKINDTLYSKTWNIVKNRSERQFGAFVFVYTSCIKKDPYLLSKHNIELRNKIVHKGYFPTMNETYLFAHEILEIISKTMKEIQEHLPLEQTLHEQKNLEKNIQLAKNHVIKLASEYPHTIDILKTNPVLYEINTFLKSGKIKIEDYKVNTENYVLPVGITSPFD